MPDPKLKPIMAEIEAVLKRHDVAGVVMIQSQTHIEYLMEIAPTWSCCWCERHAEGLLLRVKAKRADYPTADAHHKVLHDTVGMIMGFTDCARSVAGNLEMVAARIADKVPFNHVTVEEERPRPPPGVPPSL